MDHRILFLAANPVDTDRVALDREARAIQDELERGSFRASIELVTRWATQPLDLLRELRKLQPTIVHFSGHGGSRVAGAAHALFFQGPDGRAQPVSTEALALAFAAAGGSVQVVVLNACHSDHHARALLAHVESVVSMAGVILDDAARSFAIGFYGGLAERASVASAYQQGRAAIGLSGVPGSDQPRLAVR